MFISFALGPLPRGTQSYASDLARRLRERDFTVFFSEDEAPPGEPLTPSLRTALHRSRMLVVVANRGTLAEPRWVRTEVEEFKGKHPDRPVIPISVGGALQDPALATHTEVWLGYKDRIWLDESEQAVATGLASETLVERLALAPTRARSNVQWRWVVRGVIGGLAILTATSIIAAVYAVRQRDEAILQARIALSRGLSAVAQQKLAEEQPQVDVALLGATQAVNLDASPAATRVLLAALQEHPRLHRLLRPEARAYAVEFSPDGSRLASAGEDGAISIWETSTGKRLRRIADAHQDKIWGLAFVPGGKRVVTASLDRTAAIWDVESGQMIGQRMTGVADEILSLAVSGDGRLAATAALDGSVWLWDLERQQPIRKLDKAHQRGARAVAFNRDGTSLASGGFDGMIRRWRIPTGEPLPGPGKAHGGAVLRLAFSQDGSMLGSAGEDGTVQRWSTRTWRSIFPKPFSDHERGVLGLAFSPDGRELASGGEDNRIVVWRPGESEDTTVISGYYKFHNNQVWQVAWSPDGNLLAAASWDGTISLWNARGAVGFKRELSDYPEGIHGLAIDPAGGVLALGDPAGNVHLHAIREEPVRADVAKSPVLRDQQGEVLSLAFSKSGALLASGALDGTVAVWDMREGRRLLWKTKLPKAVVFDMAFSPDEAMLLAAGGNGALMRWEARTGQAIPPVLQPHRSGAGSAVVAFHPAGKYFASGGRGGDVFLWDAATGQRLHTLLKGDSESESTGVDSMAFSPDGRMFIAVPGGPSLHVWTDGSWDSHTEHNLNVGIDRIAFSADSRILAVGGGGEASLWDVKTMRRVAGPFRGLRKQVWGLALSGDGKWLAASTPDASASLWNLDLKVWKDQACRIANRNLDADEWREMVGSYPYEKTCSN